MRGDKMAIALSVMALILMGLRPNLNILIYAFSIIVGGCDRIFVAQQNFLK
ncbi:hypothetical protein [Anabaena subtropica]|uniref:Uncharacterized protein n=1 Tax=Anabaena subtropica FACHB-260 TaxID=2692884 RepID=A0ABR8CP99_9NOST|nr:hypothetical protein [Anabaena subtropica]MBD2344300.1 hypothetical protein [Anabaena subtropica FACHB-260]